MQTVNIIECGPRDGFQNLSDYIPPEKKLAVIDSLVNAGVREMEFTSFVHPRAIPQLRDAKELTQAVLERYPGVHFFPLVPNLHGARSAVECGLDKVAYVVSFSATHNRANINRTHEESLGELKTIRGAYPELDICLDLATAFGCPFEGKYLEVGRVVDFLSPYVDAGVNEVCLCDTIGIADPAQVRRLIGVLNAAYPALPLQIHVHDTRGMGLLNTITAIQSGVSAVQSTLGGLGGCPFAPGASGNTATEDLVYALTEMGYHTGIDFRKILRAAKDAFQTIPGIYSGHHIHIEKETPCTVY